MKAKIHPHYYPRAKVICRCGNTFFTGSTQKTIRVAVCSACHPYFTGGGQRFINQGRVDRFRAQVARAQKLRQQTKG